MGSMSNYYLYIHIIILCVPNSRVANHTHGNEERQKDFYFLLLLIQSWPLACGWVSRKSLLPASCCSAYRVVSLNINSITSGVKNNMKNSTGDFPVIFESRISREGVTECPHIFRGNNYYVI